MKNVALLVIGVALWMPNSNAELESRGKCAQAAGQAVQALVQQNASRSRVIENVTQAGLYHQGVVLHIYSVITQSSYGSREWKVELDSDKCQVVSITSMGRAR